MNDNKNRKVDPEIFTLVSVATGLSFYAWDISFNMGAFGVIFLGHIIAIWVFSLSILLIITIVDQLRLPGRKWVGYLMLSLPSIWLILKIFDDTSTVGQATDQWVHLASILALGLSLPYMIYLFFYFTHPGIIHFKRRILVSVASIVLCIALFGYTLGRHNYWVMSCQNFIVSGQDTPKNCVEAKT